MLEHGDRQGFLCETIVLHAHQTTVADGALVVDSSAVVLLGVIDDGLKAALALDGVDGPFTLFKAGRFSAGPYLSLWLKVPFS